MGEAQFHPEAGVTGEEIVLTVVLGSLLEEGIEAHARQCSTGDAHEHPTGLERIGHHQCGGSVRGELGRTGPLEERQVHPADREAQEEGPGQRTFDELPQEYQGCRVVVVLGEDVAEFMGQNRGGLVGVVGADERGLDDDDRVFAPMVMALTTGSFVT